jgi:hypothetical protein
MVLVSVGNAGYTADAVGKPRFTAGAFRQDYIEVE